MTEELLVVGKVVTQPDAVAKATGSAKFTADIKMPGMLVGKVLRSPCPHAKILKIDKRKAEQLPGVEAIITLDDLPHIAYACSFRDLPGMVRSGSLQRPDQFILADKVRYVGDSVAAVAAISEDIADAALDLIGVEYEKLPAVLNPEEAMKPDSPRVHDYVEGNISGHYTYRFTQGDVDKAFKEADTVVEGTYETTKQVHAQLEPQTVVAHYDITGRVTVWSPCQLPHLAKRELAHIFEMQESKIRLINPYVGGSFGCRLSIYNEPICIALAMKTGKPVKIEYTKEEDFSALETRTPAKYDVKMGFKKDGTLMGAQLKVITWAGGYAGRSQLVGNIMLMFGLGHYRCPNRAGEVYNVYTNTPMSGAMRGFGNPEIMWGVEQTMDIAAERLGIDPLELRLKNILKVGELSNHGVPIESTALDKCIRLGAQRIGWKEKRGKKKTGLKRRGVGMATAAHSSGAYPLLLEHSSAFIKLNGDGSASLIVHPGSPGTSIWGTLSQIAAEELGIRAEDINVVTGDTDVTMFEIGSHASRSTYVIGNAVLMAVRQAKRKLLERAAKRLAVAPTELEAKDRKIYVRADPEKSIPIAKVVYDAIYGLDGECLSISGSSSWEAKSSSSPTAAYFAEVEVDIETGEVKVLKLITAIDSGKAINPMVVEGQWQGAIAQGIGFALTENYKINQTTGIVETNNFDTYKIPSISDIPESEVILVEEPDPTGPFGAKGTGEFGLTGVAPAIGNAIYNGVGVRIKELPITADKILMALEEKANTE
jgi:xanthine dehydrogenase molybdenum-binding subunit